MTFQPGEVLLGKYQIEELVGQGAFAEVYRALHLKLNAPRALKVLQRDTPGLGSTEYGDYKARFKLEAQLGAKLNHPTIIQVHDFEQNREDLILVMEYAEGGNLGKRIEQVRDSNKPIPIEDAIQIAIDTAEGLAALHAKDVVHRDLKPSNILFDDQGHAKVADLGLAQFPGGPSMRSQLSNPLPHPGTPAYMSPEQAKSKDYLTSASDVYALGLVLFESLTGHVYRGQEPGTHARDLRREVPIWLDDLLVKMLAEEPKDRPWNGAKAADLLRAGMEKGGREKYSEPAILGAEQKSRQAEKTKALQDALQREQQKEERHAAEISGLVDSAQQAILSSDLDHANRLMIELEKLGSDGQVEATKLQNQIIQGEQEAEERIGREKKEQDKEIARLTHQIEAALAGKDWENAKRLIRQLEILGSGGKAAAERLHGQLPRTKSAFGWSLLIIIVAIVVFVVGGVFVIVLIASSNGGNGLPTPHPGLSAGNKDLKIVSSLPMTGASLTQTQTIVNAEQLRLIQANNQACGGRYTLSYQAWDDASASQGYWDPAVETENGNKAAADPTIIAYLGTFNSGAAKLSIPILDQAGPLVMISPANTYPGLTKPGYAAGEPDVYYPAGVRNYVRVVTADDVQGKVDVTFMSTQLGVKTVYILDDQQLYGKGVADVFEKTAKSLGITVLGHEGIDTKAADYKALMTKISKSNNGKPPDAIFVGMVIDSNATQLLKDKVSIMGSNTKVKFMGPDGIQTQAMIDGAGASVAEGIYASVAGLPFDKLNAAGQKFLTDYEAKYGKLTEPYAVYGYETMNVLLQAIENVCASGGDPSSRKQVRDAVFAIQNFNGVLGTWSFDQNGDTTLTDMAIYQVKKGAFVAIGTYR